MKKYTVLVRQVHSVPVEAFTEDEAWKKAKVILSYGFGSHSSEEPEVLSVEEWVPYRPETGESKQN